MRLVRVIPRGVKVVMPYEPYNEVPKEGVIVDWPGPYSYWARRLNEGIIAIEEVRDEHADRI